jgi:hypothetical protein
MKKPVPYDFVLSELEDLSPYTKPMFGCTGVYIGEKIVFILRQKLDPLPDDGVWLATTGEHHASLQKDFPSMRSIELFGPGPTGWQVLPVDAEDFEDGVLKACELVRQNDPRIGKIPKARWKKKTAKAKTRTKTAKDKAVTKQDSPKKSRTNSKAKPSSKVSKSTGKKTLRKS